MITDRGEDAGITFPMNMSTYEPVTSGMIEHEVVIVPPKFMVYIYACTIAIGICNNAIIIYMFRFKSKLKSPSNLLIVNLAVADAFYLFCVTTTATTMFFYGGRKFFGDIGCKALAVATILSAGGSLLTMGLIAVTRYIAIVHPQKKHLLTWNRGIGLCIYPWIHVTILIVPGVTGVGRIGWHAPSWICTVDWLYNILYNIIVFICSQGLSSGLMLFCYSQIYMAYKKSKQRVAGDSSGQGGVKKEEIRLAIQLVVIFAIYNICWSPFFVFNVFVFPHGDGPPWLYAVNILLLAINSSVNIFVYLYFNRTFRNECFSIVGIKIETSVSSTS